MKIEYLDKLAHEIVKMQLADKRVVIHFPKKFGKTYLFNKIKEIQDKILKVINEKTHRRNK